MIDDKQQDIIKVLDDIDDHINIIQEDIAYLRDKYGFDVVR